MVTFPADTDERSGLQPTKTRCGVLPIMSSFIGELGKNAATAPQLRADPFGNFV
jgi:hypothetical protein